MDRQQMNPDLFARYLDILRIPRKKPSYEALSELVAAHLRKIPFENISKLYYRNQPGWSDLPELEKYLDGIERYNFGGTCYVNNNFLNQLLRQLGYQIKLCGADMNNPDVHIVNMVTIGNREYIVDVGYTGPFDHPVPRDLSEDYEIVLGRERFVFKPQDAQGNTCLELYRDGVLKHGYTAKPEARRIEEFAEVIDDSFSDEATFMNAILIVRFFANRSLVLHNLTLLESEGESCTKRRLSGREELAPTIEKHFGIPREIVSEAIAGLGKLGDAWT